jgi:cobalt-zinc-cadmium efflux system outer membrane protein
MHTRQRTARCPRRLCFGLPFGVLMFAATVAAHAQSTATLTLEQALKLAEQNSPALLTAQAEVQALEAQANEAGAWLWNNPELSGGVDRRRIPDSGNVREWNVELAQTFELAGQPRHRRESASQQLAAARALYEETRLRLRTAVTQTFAGVLALEQRLAMEEALLKLIDELSAIVQKRFKAGEDTRLQANLAAVEADRARNDLGRLREELIEARRALAAELQLPPDALPRAKGDLAGAAPPYTLEELLQRIGERPLLRSLQHRENAARSRLSLEQAAAYPDVTVGVSAGREAPEAQREEIVGLSVSVPLPLFKRNRAAIGRAGAELTQARVDRAVTERDTRAAVFALWQRLQSAQARVRLLSEATVPRLEENQRLARRSFEVGQIGIAEVLLATRQLIELRRDAIEAQAQLAVMRAELEQAAGWLAPRSQ